MTKSVEARLDAIEERLSAMDKRQRDVDYVERELIEAARQYARVVKLGYYNESYGDGRIAREAVSGRVAESLRGLFLRKMQSLAEDLLCAETS